MAYETRVNDAKRESVEKLKKEFSNYDGYIFVDYRGLTVEQITDLRHQLKSNDSAFRVVKNNFAKLAMRNFSDKLDDVFVGPVAIAYVKGDKANEVAKTLFKVAKDTSKLSVKAGFVNGEVMTGEKLEAMSKLPSRLELIASLMGTMKAPVQKLAATLKAYMESKGSAA